MDYITLILLSVGLAMDCFAVSLAKAGCVGRVKVGGFLFMAIMFGLFQGLMPLIGYFIGNEFIDYIRDYDHWIAFAILAFIGGKMIWEDLFSKEDESCEVRNPYSVGTVMLLSIATSIDALATGLVFLTAPESLWRGIIIIGVGSFLISLIGSFTGAYAGQKLHFKFGVLGGVILIAIGVKIVIEHCCG